MRSVLRCLIFAAQIRSDALVRALVVLGLLAASACGRVGFESLEGGECSTSCPGDFECVGGVCRRPCASSDDCPDADYPHCGDGWCFASADPPQISYPQPLLSLTRDVPMSPVVPTLTGDITEPLTIRPALPSGLSFEPSTGEISGTPTATQDLVSHTIEATNPWGTASYELSLVIGALDPRSFYPGQSVRVSRLFGTLVYPPGGVEAVELSYDGGAFSSAVGVTDWEVTVPGGWRHGSTHTLTVRAKDVDDAILLQRDFPLRRGLLKDVDGDGYADAIVGARQVLKSGQVTGAAYLYRGGPAGLAETSPGINDAADLVFGYPYADANPRFGHDVAIAGDINGDGFADVLVSAMTSDLTAPDAGAVFVYYGRSGGLPEDEPGYLETHDVWLQYPGSDDGRMGRRLAGVGDLNADGYDDVMVSCPTSDLTGTDEGAVFVYYGSAAGLSESSPGVVDRPDLILQYPSTGPSDFSGRSALTGDLNGDGFDDLVACAFSGDDFGLDQGACYVYYGTSSGLREQAPGLNDTPDLTLANPGTGTTELFGFTTCGADFDQDGFSDLAVGAYLSDRVATDQGNVYVYYGTATGLRDDGGGINTSPDLVLLYPVVDETQAWMGTHVACNGDIDGDGYPDLVVGVQFASLAASSAGAAFVYLGGPGGLTESAPGVNDAPDFQLLYPLADPSAYMGRSVSIAGDMNGDSYDEILVGAYRADRPSPAIMDVGTAFLYYGGVDGPTADAAGVNDSGGDVMMECPVADEAAVYSWSLD